MRRKHISRIIAFAMVTVMTFTSTDVFAAVHSTEAQSEIEDSDEDITIDESEGIEEIEETEELSVSDNSITADGDSYGLSNPRRDDNGVVTWDCVYFGSYPQAEVVADKSPYTAIWNDYLSDGDIIEDSGLYGRLQSATFNDKNLATVTYSGSTYTYKRMKKGNATYTSSSSGRYNWSDSTTYHYFRCEPIKWRVLSVNGSDAFLLADKGLDDQSYNPSGTAITWEKSTIRSWLNGYGSTVNKYGTDYSSNGDSFIDTAFTSGEKAAIKTTSVVNADNTEYGTDGGNDTSDKVFLLSEAEVYSTANGFSSDYSTYDKCRRSKSSTYAKAMGAWWSTTDDYRGKCDWWLRSPGVHSYDAAHVNNNGLVNRGGYYVSSNSYAARPALHINLSSNLHTLAGTVSSEDEAVSYGVANPKRDDDGVVTWDCVYFGSYPQAEVVADKSAYTAIGSDYLSDEDLIEDSDLYSRLQSATFNDKNLATINYSGSTYTYKRMKKENATYGTNIILNNYKWSDSTTYHYFRCEPIKWRVLSVNGSDAFLLADKGLDDQKYNTKNTSITWEKSTIRSWLNGYGSTVNTEGTDYSSNGDNFIDTAFTSGEKGAIKTTSVVNADNTYYGTDGGNDTSDKVFLLSEAEVYSTANGFSADHSTSDKCRRSKSSTYAKAMGAYCATFDDCRGNCWWWLRSPGNGSPNAACVSASGYVNRSGYLVDYGKDAARPALHINLSSNLHTLAGTVSSEGEAIGDKEDTEQYKDGNVEVTIFANKENSSSEKDDYKIIASGVITTDKGNDFIVGTSGAKQGKATLDISKIDSSVNITSEGYVSRTISKNHLLFKDDKKIVRAKSVYMEPENSKAPTVLAVWVDDVDVRHESYNLSDISTESTTLEAEVEWGSSSAGSIFLYQNGLEEKFTDNTLTTVISKKFDTASTIYICAKDASGRITKKPLCFKNMTNKAAMKWLDGFSVSFADKASTTLHNSIPFFGGTKLNVGAYSAVPITYTVENGKFYAAIGLDTISVSDKFGDKKDAKVKGIVKNIKEMIRQRDAKKKYIQYKKLEKDYKKYLEKLKGSMGWEFDLTVVGFAEGTIDVSGKVHLLDGGMIFNPSGSIKANYPFAIPPVPVPMYVEGSIGADFENQLNLAISNDAKGFIPSGEISGTVKFEIGACVGVKNIVYGGGGVNGGVSPDWIIRLDSPDYFKLTASAGGYLKAGFLFWEGRKDFKWADSVWLEQPKPGSGKSSVLSLDEGAPYNIEEYDYKLKDISYLDSEGNGWGNISPLDIEGDNRNVLVTNVYKESQVSYVKTSAGDRVAFWITSEDSDANNLQLYYSINKSGEWSSPEKVLDDGTIDYMPVAVEYNGTAAVAWMNATDSFELDDDLTMDEVASHMEIRLAILNGNSFESYKLDSEGCDMLPCIAENGSKLCVAWVNNADSHIMGEGSNSIQYAVFDGSSVGEITTAYKDLKAVDGLAMSYDGSVNLAYTQDTDGDYDTTDDIRLYENGTAVAKSDYMQVRPQYYNNDLYWYCNGNIINRTMCIEGKGIIPLAPYNLVTTDGSLQVFYLNGNGKNNRIYASTYNLGSNMWSTPTPYLDHDNYIFSFDVIDDGSECEFITTDVAIIGEEISEESLGRADISVTQINMQVRPKIEYVGYEMDNVESDNTVLLNCIISNSGNYVMDGYKILVTDDNKPIALMLCENPVFPGEKSGVDIEVNLPEGTEVWNLNVICESNGSDGSRSEPYEVKINNENIYIDNCNIIFDTDGSAEVRCGIGNAGKQTRDDLIVTLYETNSRGEVVETKRNITSVPGKFSDLLFNISDADETVYYLCIENADDEYPVDDSEYLFSEDYEDESRIVISFDANGGTVNLAQKEIVVGKKYGSLPVPTREGYRFLGWYTEVEYGSKIKSTDVVSKDITLYAHWKEKQPGDSDVPEEDPEHDYERKIVVKQKIGLTTEDFCTTETIAKYTLSSKKLASINRKGVLKAKKPGDVTVTAYKKTGSRKYEVVGEPLTFHIEKPVLNKTTMYKVDQTINANDTILSDTTQTPLRWTSSKPSVATVDENTGVITAVKSGTAKITAYFGEESNSAKYSTKLIVKIPRVSPSKTNITAGKTKKLKIKNTSLTVSEWKSSDESVARVDESGTVIAVSAGNADISATVDGVDYECEITVKGLSANKHLLWFDPNGGSVNTRNKVVTSGRKYGKLPTPTWKDHTFLGWYTEPTGGTPVTASDLADSSDCTIYAVWDNFDDDYYRENEERIGID